MCSFNFNNQKKVQEKAFLNYSNNNPWPYDDVWHEKTRLIIENYVNLWTIKNIKKSDTCLNIGSGNTEYLIEGELIQMDIVEDYIKKYPNSIVGSIENIPLGNESVDSIICVGSVINYCDAIRSISEIARVLKKSGKAVIEFERSNSSEFLFTNKHNSITFLKDYNYNNQKHFLWMYNEKFIIEILNQNGLKILSKHRFHTLSSLLYRMGVNEKKASKYSKYDSYLKLFSYPLSHNVLIEIKK